MSLRVLALCGGIGGAKLALGLHTVLPPGHLTVVANTGDDFEHLGLCISPDVDTVLYTLAGIANPQTGWGRAEETWHFMAELERVGGPTWFQLGDKDLATHVERTRRLRSGERLHEIIDDFSRRFGIAGTVVLPMSNDSVRTIVHADQGNLGFQDYFVARRCAPIVQRISYQRAEQAHAAGTVLQQLAESHFDAVIICPSNPYLSIQPLLAIPEWHSALQHSPAPVIAISPIIAGNAVKGPTAKIMRELGVDVSAVAVARHYDELIDGFVVDEADANCMAQLTVRALATRTLMQTLADKQSLAQQVLQFAATLR
ncbi:MAG: 2-phospho-L-lactate transferase [Steroidobacteraceae bacterium]